MESKNLSDINIMRTILEELSSMKAKMSTGDWKIIQLSIEDLKNSQSDIKKDLSDLKKKLLDPDDGVIVKVNENTKFRIDQEKIQDKEELEYKSLLTEHNELMKWKEGVTKALWIFFTSIVGILAKIFFLSGN